ncbi:hypothetical protein D3C84_701320 [compost metagenome]
MYEYISVRINEQGKWETDYGSNVRVLHGIKSLMGAIQYHNINGWKVVTVHSGEIYKQEVLMERSI